MTAEALLRQIRDLTRQIEAARLHIEALTASAERLNGTRFGETRVRSGGDAGGRLDIILNQIDATVRGREQDIRALNRKLSVLYGAIFRLRDPQQRLCLLLRHAMGCSMRETAVELGVCERQAYRIWHAALDALELPEA